FGIWGPSPDDLWAAGGDPDGGAGFAWKYDGTAWSPASFSPEIPTADTLFKVWGTSSSDVWFCGSSTAAFHFDGSTFANTSAVLADSERPLFTVAGDSGRVV